MAASAGGDVSSGNTQQRSWFQNFGDLVIDYTRARYIDSETQRDDNNIVDQNDLVHNVSPGAYGSGVTTPQFMGVSPQGWAIGGGILLASLIALKAFKVI